MEITGLSLSEIDKLSQRFKGRVTINLRRVGSRFNQLVKTVTNPLQETGRIKSEWTTVVDNILLPQLQLAWLTGATSIQHQLDSVEDAIISAAEIPIRTQSGESFLAKSRERLLSIGDELWDRINREVADGLSLGETDLYIYQRVADTIEVTIENVAELIAVSEFHNIIVRSQYAQMLTSQRSPTKTWRSHSDSSVRSSHSSVEDKTIPLREMFDVSGSWMDGPYDPTAPTGEVINCRCWLTYGIDVDEENRKALTASANESKKSGAMIALIPTEEDAKRLAISDMEPVEELHLTLAFLGEADGMPENTLRSLTDSIQQLLETYGIDKEIVCRGFGIAHWNPESDMPSWVMNVGDDLTTDETRLGLLHYYVLEAVDQCGLAIPAQHSPYVPHICLAYTDTSFATRLSEMIERLGPITFDRVRIAIGDTYQDVLLSN